MSEHQNCIFCGEPEIVIQNELAFAHYDSYPVNTGHCLIIPHRHVAEYFQATAEEKAAIWALVEWPHATCPLLRGDAAHPKRGDTASGGILWR